MDKKFILDNLEFLSARDIVMAILKGIVSLEEIKESDQIEFGKLKEIELSLNRAYKEWHFYNERLSLLKVMIFQSESQVMKDARMGRMSEDKMEEWMERISLMIDDSVNSLKRSIQDAEFLEEDDSDLIDSRSILFALKSVYMGSCKTGPFASIISGHSNRFPGSTDEILPLSNRISRDLERLFRYVTSPLFSGVSMTLPTDSLQDENKDTLKEIPIDETVYSAVYAPSCAEFDVWFKVSAFLYNKTEAELVNQRALEMDDKTHLMEKKPLSLKIKPGTQVEAEISICDERVQVTKTKRILTWNGELTSVVFQVKATDPLMNSVAGDITFSTNGIPLGEFSFNTEIVYSYVRKEELELGKAKSFTKAFISYGHEDADQAEKVKNTLQGLGYKCFYDRDSLASGDLFDTIIMKSIEESDVFFLLWSKYSAQSEYVEKEYLHALPLAYPPYPEPAKLEFKPFFIDSPPTDPPVVLKKLHFSVWPM